MGDDNDEEKTEQEPSLLELKNLLRRCYALHPELKHFLDNPDETDFWFPADAHHKQISARLK